MRIERGDGVQVRADHAVELGGRHGVELDRTGSLRRGHDRHGRRRRQGQGRRLGRAGVRGDGGRNHFRRHRGRRIDVEGGISHRFAPGLLSMDDIVTAGPPRVSLVVARGRGEDLVRERSTRVALTDSGIVDLTRGSSGNPRVELSGRRPPLSSADRIEILPRCREHRRRHSPTAAAVQRRVQSGDFSP